MYSRYGKRPVSSQEAKRYSELFIAGVDDQTAKRLYDERVRLFEILDVVLDLGTYLLVLSLRASKNIDEHIHLHVEESLMGYGKAAMEEMLVIRLRDLFHTEEDRPEKFKFYGFHQTLSDLGKPYPRPNPETNNAIARIIKRRRFYSAHHGTGRNKHSFEKNRLRSLDLLTALLYIAKVEASRHGLKDFDPFERLLNDELEVDRPLVTDDVFESLTWSPPYVSEGDNDISTPAFGAYQLKVRNELQKIRTRVEKIIM